MQDESEFPQWIPDSKTCSVLFSSRREDEGHSSAYYCWQHINIVSTTSLSCSHHIFHSDKFVSVTAITNGALETSAFGQMEWQCNILLLGWTKLLSWHTHASIICPAVLSAPPSCCPKSPAFFLSWVELSFYMPQILPSLPPSFFFISSSVGCPLLKLTDSSSPSQCHVKITPVCFQPALIKRMDLSGPLQNTQTHRHTHTETHTLHTGRAIWPGRKEDRRGAASGLILALGLLGPACQLRCLQATGRQLTTHTHSQTNTHYFLVAISQLNME